MISKEQWYGIQNTLGGLFCEVCFTLPSGEAITVKKSMIAENKMALIVWINGEHCAGWGIPGHKDFRPVTKLVWRRKTFKPGARTIREASKTAWGKKWLKKKENTDVHRVCEYWVCYFSTAASLVRQFRQIDGLTLVTPSGGLCHD